MINVTEKPDGKRSLTRRNHRWEDKITMDIKEIM
jgi:hypothetical protein